MQLLSTKFHIPGFNKERSVSRDTILSRLKDSENAKIILVSAPAGFGKTTFASELVLKIDAEIAWLSLDKNDNESNGFWIYFLGAISESVPSVGEKSLAMLETGSVPVETALINLINDIEKTGKDLVFVLDDYHVITESSIHKVMEFFIDHLPENLKLVLIGREDPPFSLSRMRVSGDLCEVRADDLRFEKKEMAFLLNDLNEFELAEEDIMALTERTEGWAAGIALAILSLREHDDKKKFVREFTGSHRFILDYLVEEVLSGLPENIRKSMLEISVLDRFCDPLCRAVTGNSEDTGLLKYMEQNNLFLIPLDSHRKWFRYHHLFCEFMLQHLFEEFSGQVPTLHERASDWFQKNGYGQEAFRHAIKAGKMEKAADFLAGLSPELLNDSGDSILSSLFDKLPESIINSHYKLCCYKVWMNILQGEFEYIKMLDFNKFKDIDHAGKKEVEGFRAAISGYLAFYQEGDFDKCIEHCSKALDLLPEINEAIRKMAEIVLGVACRYSGQLGPALEIFEKDISCDGFMSILHVQNMADLKVEMGELNYAFKLLEDALENVKEKYGENILPMYGYLYIIMANILREKNRLQEAEEICRTGLILSKESGHIELIMLGYFEYAKILACSGEYEEADAAIGKSLNIARETSSWAEFLITGMNARFALMKGDIKTVEKWAKESGLLTIKGKMSFHRSVEFLTLARLLIRRGKTDEAHSIINSMMDEDVPVKRNGRLLECLILQAEAFFVSGKMEESATSLNKAFTLSEDNGHVRIFLDEGDEMHKMLHDAEKKNMLPRYLASIIKPDAPEFKGRKDKKEKISVVINDFKEEFNQREVEVLKLMKTGKSNNDIAETLFLSVNTVRWYAGRLFAKLDVKRRGEAVARAIELGII